MSLLPAEDPGGDVAHHVVCVAADAVDLRRRRGVEEVQADEVQAGLGPHDPAGVHRVAVVIEDGQVDPREVGAEPGAPDDVGHVEHPAVLEQRQPVLDADGPRYPLDAGSGEVLGLDPYEWQAVALGQLALDLARRPRVRLEDTVEGEPDHRIAGAGGEAVDGERDVADVASRQHGGVTLHDLHGDVGARVAGPDDEHVTVLQLGGVAVVEGVELDHSRIQLGRERGDPRPPLR